MFSLINLILTILCLYQIHKVRDYLFLYGLVNPKTKKDAFGYKDNKNGRQK